MREVGPRLIVLAAARKDARKTILYYHRQNPQLARDVEDVIERSIRTIEEAPLRWAEVDPEIRRYLTPRFPVSIFYRLVGERVYILRIVDQRRHPGAWRIPP